MTKADTKQTSNDLTAEPVKIPAPNFEQAVHFPEFLRLPKPGQLCAHTGLSRSYINMLVLPTEANSHKPPVKSFVLRQRGAKTGVRLVDYQDLRRYILQHAETGAGKEAGE